jgi:hypothetical protein
MEETMQSAKAIAKCYEHSQIHQREEEVTGMKYQMSPDLDGMKMVRLWDNEDLESRQVESMAELKEELSKDTVMSIAKARSEGTIMQTCEHKGKKREVGAYAGGKAKESSRQWGSYIAESHGAKEEKNMEYMQGNPFATLQFENLS